MKRWSLRQHLADWRQATTDAQAEKTEGFIAELEAQVKKSEEHARALEEKYAATESALKEANLSHVEATRAWERQQEEQYESLVKRSQIFMQRWTLRSHLSAWHQQVAAVRAGALQQSMADLEAEKEGLSAEAEKEKLRLLAEQARLHQEHGKAERTLSEELEVARREVARLTADLGDLESKHKKAVTELSESAAAAAALQKQVDTLHVRVSELSTLLEGSQEEERKLRASMQRLETASQSSSGRAKQAGEEIAELRNLHAALSAQLSAKAAEGSKMKVELAEVKSELMVAKAAVKDLEEQLGLARDDGEDREQVLAELQTQTLPGLRSEIGENELTIRWGREFVRVGQGETGVGTVSTRACTQRLHCLLIQRLCFLLRKLSAQLAAAQELLRHNEKEAAAREESLSQAMAAGNK